MEVTLHRDFLKRVKKWLFIFLLLMIAGFFTWSENIIITRAIKLLGRNGVLIGIFLLYRYLLNYGLADTNKRRNHLSLYLYIAYLTLGFASFMWSTNVGFSSIQWFMTLQSLVFCILFIRVLNLVNFYFGKKEVNLYDLLGNAIFCLIMVFIIGMYVAPDTFYRLTHGGSEARLGGYLMNPNELGMLAGVGIASQIFNLLRKHKMFWTIVKIGALAFALFATGSRSSLIGVLLIALFHIHHSQRRLLKVFLFVGITLLSPIAIYKVVLKNGDPERMEEVMTMTGRLPFWQALINEGLPREPFLGFGFMRIDYKEYFQSNNTYPGKMTHNTFLQVLMNLGFVGLVLVLFQMLFTIKSILGEEKSRKKMLICLCIPILINSMTEFGIFGESNYGILFYQLIILSISYECRSLFTNEEKLKLRIKKLLPSL